jgi:hypothetical protein
MTDPVEQRRARAAAATKAPDGADEDKPETECPQCGHTPTYAFMPEVVPV